MTTETLLARGWADTEDADPSYVWVTMRRLRQKVEVDPNKPVHLLTVRGIGYRLVAARRPETGDRAGGGRRPAAAVTAGGGAAATGADGRGGPAPAEAAPRADRTRRRRAPGSEADADGGRRRDRVYRSSGLGFRTRLTLGLIAAAVLPVAAFGIVVLLVTGLDRRPDTTVARVLLLAIAVVGRVRRPAGRRSSPPTSARRCGRIARSVERVSAGDDHGRLELPGDDEFSRLAESHNRLARDLARRNRELRQIVVALEAITPRRAPRRHRPPRGRRRRASAFGMIDCELLLVDPREIPTEELVPGDPVPVRADLVAAGRAARRRRRATCPPRGAGSARTRTCSSCSRSRSRRRSATPSCTRGSRTRTGASWSSTRRRTTSCAASRTTSRRRWRASAATRSSWPRTRPTGGWDHHRAGRPPVADGPPAADGEPDRVGRAAARGSRSSRPRPRVRRTWEALGVADVPFTLEDRLGGLARPRRRRPAGPGPVGAPRQRGRATAAGPRSTSRSPSTRRPATSPITIADHGAGRRRGGPRAAVPALRARQPARPADEGSGLGPLRLPRAVPRDERRPRPRAGRAGPGRRVHGPPARRGGRGELATGVPEGVLVLERGTARPGTAAKSPERSPGHPPEHPGQDPTDPKSETRNAPSP